MMNNDTISVTCPTCRLQVMWHEKNLFRPFCSKRCQLIDLNGWAKEEKSIHGAHGKESADSDNWSDET